MAKVLWEAWLAVVGMSTSAWFYGLSIRGSKVDELQEVGQVVTFEAGFDYGNFELSIKTTKRDFKQVAVCIELKGRKERKI